MCWKNTKDRWGAVGQSFHWVIAVLIIGMAIVGKWMVNLPPESFKWFTYGWHKQVGVLVFSLVTLRVLWRWMNVVPELPSFLPRWQKMAAHLNIVALYIIMFGFPITGLSMSLLGGHDVDVFGVVTLRAFEETPELSAIAHIAWEIHGWFLWALIAFGGIHVLAAIYHHIILKDDVLKRMLPARWFGKRGT